MSDKQTKYDGVSLPTMPPRPPGVSRQEHRRHFREALALYTAQQNAHNDPKKK